MTRPIRRTCEKPIVTQKALLTKATMGMTREKTELALQLDHRRYNLVHGNFEMSSDITRIKSPQTVFRLSR